MDGATKRRQAEAVRRGVTHELSTLGFARTKPTFWTRSKPHRIEFVHLQLLSFAPSFRVHLGVRVLNDTFPAAALNGPVSHSTNPEYVLEFGTDRASCDRCSEHVGAFVRDAGVPWFERMTERVLMDDRASPLDADARVRLRAALAGDGDEAAAAFSRTILGMPE